MNEIAILFCINTLSAVGYSLIAPLYPIVAREKDVNDTIVGIIFASFAISNVIIIPLIPNLVTYFGKKVLFSRAIILEGCCTILYGWIHYIPNKFLFILLSFILRFSQGIGCAITSTLIFSISASSSDEDKVKANIGYMELSYSIGLTIGPLIGSFFYHFLGMSSPFFISGWCMILSNRFVDNWKIEDIKVDSNSGENPNFFKWLSNWNMFLTFIAVCIDMISTSFIYPVFANHLVINFGLTIEKTSFFFIIQMFTYFMTLQFLDRISNIWGAKWTMSVGLFWNIVFVLFLCPVSVLPQSLFIIIIGLIGLGMTGALITIPAIVDLMDESKDFLNIDETWANDYASGWYNLGVNIAESVGPIIGGTWTEIKSFNFTCYSVSLSILIYVTIFTVKNYRIIIEQLYEEDDEDETTDNSKEYRQKSTQLIRKHGKFSRVFSIHSRYSLPNKLKRTRSLNRSFSSIGSLPDFGEWG